MDLTAIPNGCPVPICWPPPDDFWAQIFVACSNGVDSLVLADLAVQRFGPARITVLYHLLGNEHRRSPQQAAERCRAWGVPILYTWKDAQNRSCFGPEIPAVYLEQEGMAADHDLIVRMAEARGQWPSAQAPYCTSGTKRDTADVAIRRAALPAEHDLVVRLAESRGQWPGASAPFCTDRGKAQTSDVAMRASEAAIAGLGAPGAILLLTGELRAESASRSKKPAWQLRAGPTAPTLGRLVVWHRMILDWSKADIWQYLVERGIPVPTSYREGFARHSCVHCIHKGWHEIVLAFALYPEGAARRVAAEERMGHRVRLDYQWGEYVGYRAAWEFVYGPWEGAYLGAPVRDEARAQIAAWQASGRYFAPPPGVVWAD